jgi:hypothetical protein
MALITRLLRDNPSMSLWLNMYRPCDPGINWLYNRNRHRCSPKDTSMWTAAYSQYLQTGNPLTADHIGNSDMLTDWNRTQQQE